MKALSKYIFENFRISKDIREPKEYLVIFSFDSKGVPAYNTYTSMDSVISAIKNFKKFNRVYDSTSSTAEFKNIIDTIKNFNKDISNGKVIDMLEKSNVIDITDKVHNILGDNKN